MSHKPETKFRAAKVLPFLKKLKNTYFMAVQQQSFVGDPDYILCIHGRFVALELKAEGGKLRKLQEYKLGQVEKAGGVAIVASPSNWDSIARIIQTLDEGA